MLRHPQSPSCPGQSARSRLAYSPAGWRAARPSPTSGGEQSTYFACRRAGRKDAYANSSTTGDAEGRTPALLTHLLLTLGSSRYLTWFPKFLLGQNCSSRDSSGLSLEQSSSRPNPRNSWFHRGGPEATPMVVRGQWRCRPGGKWL